MPTTRAQKAPEATTDLVVAYNHGSGYEFMRVNTTGKADEKLATIATSADERLRQAGNPKAYSIGDDIEADEAMVIAYTALAPPTDGRAVRPTRWASPRRPREFRDRLVTFPDPAGGETELRRAADNGMNIAFYAIVRGTTAADRVAYLRHRNPMAQVKPGSFFLALGNVLTTLDNDVFTMDDYVDIILEADRAYIFGKSFFDTLFFDLSAVDTEQHKTIVKAALQTLPFTDETLAAIVSSVQSGRRTRRRLMTMRESAHLKDVTVDDFRAALHKHQIPLEKFIRSGKISASNENLQELLEVLNEDLYDGYLTGRRLVASKKGLKQ